MSVGARVPQTKARLIAFYLPQFHPIPENDQWWGKGFTEWTNVARARPLFKGHYQPHIPGDVGFCDLRLPDVRLAQAELAGSHGIEAFCYWHYWFMGRRLLERPFDEVLASGAPEFPFCLAWANETWSRRWLGEERSILIKQAYSADDDLQHARWLSVAFADRRYLRVYGRPVFLIYRPTDLPEAKRTTDIIRGETVKQGLPNPYLLGINAHSTFDDSRRLGFDGTVNFEPALGALPGYNHDGATLAKLARNLELGVASASLKVYDYAEARRLMRNVRPSFPTYPTIFVGWDNTPRRGDKGIIVVNSTPSRFEIGLRELVEESMSKPYDDRLVFLNAWNEWGEGNHLEPDLQNGEGYIDALRRANSEPGRARQDA